MQYALWELHGGQKVLIDINEYQALTTNPAELKDGDLHAVDAGNLPWKLVYGSYKPQYGLRDDAEASLKSMMGSKGFLLGHVKDGVCHGIGLTDLEAFEPLGTNPVLGIPFAALVRTHIDMPSGTAQAVTGFLRYEKQMTLADNLLNRHGVFAFKAQDRRVKPEALTVENWRQHIDKARAMRAAKSAV